MTMDLWSETRKQSLVVAGVLTVPLVIMALTRGVSLPSTLAEWALTALVPLGLVLWTAFLGHALPVRLAGQGAWWWTWLATISALTAYLVLVLIRPADLSTLTYELPLLLLVTVPLGLVIYAVRGMIELRAVVQERNAAWQAETHQPRQTTPA